MARKQNYTYTSPSSIDAMFNSRPEMVARRREYEERARLAAAAAAERAAMREAEEPEAEEDFSEFRDAPTMQATPASGYVEGLWDTGVNNVRQIFQNPEGRTLENRLRSAVSDTVSALVPDSIERGYNLGEANMELAIGPRRVLNPQTGRYEDDIAGLYTQAGTHLSDAEDDNTASPETVAAMQAMAQSDSVSGWIKAASIPALGQMLGESVGQQAIPMAVSVASLGAGAPLTAASTFNTEYQSAIYDAMRKDGVNVEDGQAVANWIDDNPDKYEAATTKGATRGSIIAAVDTATLGVGGVINKVLDNTGLKRAILNSGAALVADILGGSGGEAAAQLATDGEVKVGEVLNEGFAGAPLAATQIPSTIRQGIRNERIESDRFTNSIMASVEADRMANGAIARREQDNAQMASLEEAARAEDAQRDAARRAEEAERFSNAEQPDMFGGQEEAIGTYEEQRKLREYEAEQEAERRIAQRRAWLAAQEQASIDEAINSERIEQSRDQEFEAREAERARVEQTSDQIEMAFRDPEIVEQDTTSQPTALLLAFREAESKAADKFFAAQKRAEQEMTAKAISDAELAMQEYEAAQAERKAAEEEEGFRAIEDREARRAELYSRTNFNVDTQNNPMAQQLAALGFKIGGPRATTPAPAPAPVQTAEVEAAPLTREEQIAAWWDNEATPDQKIKVARRTSNATRTRAWSDLTPAAQAEVMAIAETEGVVAPEPVAPAPEAATAPQRVAASDGGFIGPVNNRNRTVENVGEQRTTRVDESDPAPLELYRGNDVPVDLHPAEPVVVEETAPEQGELFDEMPDQPLDSAEEALAKARERRIAAENKAAKAKYTTARNKFIATLVKRDDLTDAQQLAELRKWEQSNPAPVERVSRTVTPEAPASQAATPTTDTTAIATAPAPSPAPAGAAAAAQAKAEAELRESTRAALRALMPEATDAEIEAEIEANVKSEAARRIYEQTVADADSGTTTQAPDAPSQDRATLQDVAELLGKPKSAIDRALRRLIGNDTVVLVTNASMQFLPAEAQSINGMGWYIPSTGEIFVNVDKLSKSNLKGDLLSTIAHEAKHAADLSGKGTGGIAAFIGEEANNRLVASIEKAAENGDVAARNAVERATANTDAVGSAWYKAELPAYYITETSGRTNGIVRGAVSAIRAGAKNLLGIKDVNLADVNYLADKMVKNISYETGSLAARESASTPAVLEQAAPGSTYQPTPGASIQSSQRERAVGMARKMYDNLIDPAGGLGRIGDDMIQNSIGEAAAAARQATQLEHALDKGISRMAKRAGKTEDAIREDIQTKMDALQNVPDPSRREMYLANYVKANPELKPMGEMYRIISNQSNILADHVMSKRTLTEADRKFAAKLRDSAFGYVSRLYATRQGNTGRKVGIATLRNAKIAKKKMDKGETLSVTQQEAYRLYSDAVNYLMERLLIPPRDFVSKDTPSLEAMSTKRLKELYDTWLPESSDRIYQIAYEEAIASGKKEADAREAGRQALMDGLDTDAARALADQAVERNAKADAILNALLGTDTRTANPTASRVGGMREDRGILQKREEVPEPLRRLLGEVREQPAVQLAVTIAKQAELIARHNLLTKFIEEGHVVTQDLANLSKLSNMTVKLTGESAGPLEGMYTTPMVANIINTQMSQYNDFISDTAQAFLTPDEAKRKLGARTLDGLSKVAGLTKYMSIVLDPAATAWNTAGSFGMALMNGVWHPKYYARGLWAGITSISNVATDGGGFKSEALDNAARWGVVDSARAQELRRSVHESLQDRAVRSKGMGKVHSAWRQGKGAIAETFSMSDAWVKIAAFEHQVDSLTKFYKANNETRTKEQIAEEAAAIVRRTNMTFSRVPPAVRIAERSGLLMFAPYFYSVPYMMVNGLKEMGTVERQRMAAAKTPEARAIVMERVAMRAVGYALGTAGMIAATRIVAEAINSAMSVDDEDRERIRQLAKLLREEQQSTDPAYIGEDKDGKPLFISASRADALGPVNDIIRTMLRDDLTGLQKVDAVLSQVGGLVFANSGALQLWAAVFDEEKGMSTTRLERLPGIGAAADAFAGAFDYSDRSRQFLGLVDRTLVPGVLDVLDPENTIPDVEKSPNNLGPLIGWVNKAAGGKAFKAEPAPILKGLAAELKEDIDDARQSVALKVVNSKDPADIAEFIVDESRSAFKKYEQMQRIYEGMVHGMGMSPAEAQAVLKKEGSLNKDQVRLISQGIMRGDDELAIELAGILSKTSLTQRAPNARRRDEEKDVALQNAKEALAILEREYGIKPRK